jgi:hypothetical protein
MTRTHCPTRLLVDRVLMFVKVPPTLWQEEAHRQAPAIAYHLRVADSSVQKPVSFG